MYQTVIGILALVCRINGKVMQGSLQVLHPDTIKKSVGNDGNINSALGI